MTASHISQLWRMNVQGVVSYSGRSLSHRQPAHLDYPWVVANIGTNTVHIFPWIKDTEIVQGVNLYN